MAYLDPREAFEHLQKRVLEGIQEQFARNPIVGKTQSLHLEGLEVKDTLHPDDIRAQQKAKTEGDTWAVPVYATVALKENSTGKVIDRRKIRIAEIPKTTSRYSYIIDGQEYQVDNQWQLQPGVYTRRKASGELVSKFNAGRQFDVVLDPASKIFQMKYGKSRGNLPIYPLLKTLGVSDEELTKSWGKEILDANKAAPNSNNVLERFYKADKPYATTVPTREAAAEHFYDAMEKAKLRPESTRITLGKPFTHVTGDTLKLATEKMLKVQSGHPEDDRDSLVFKDLRSAGDFAHDAIHNAGMNIKQRATRQIGKAKDVWDVLKFDMFNNPIKKSLSSGNAAARTATQINPLEMVSSAQQTTIMGSGGIQSERAVSAEAKFVNPSHLGFLDPLCTPEGSRTGITLRLPVGVRQVGHEVKIPLYNLLSKKTELVSPGAVLEANVVLPDQVKWEGDTPHPLHKLVRASAKGNEIRDVPFEDAHYVLRHPSQLFNMTSNLIPFLGNTSGNRASMASRHMEQAISLKHREAPLVQVDGPNSISTFEKLMGAKASHESPVDGKIVDIKKDAILIEDHAGTKHEVQIYNNYKLNDAKSVMHSTPIVAVGAHVKKEQTIADTNFSKNGVLALGTNLKAAFLPFRGYNFEDGVVISDSAAKKLSSEHLTQLALPIDSELVLDKKRFHISHPGLVHKAQYDKLDADGVVRVGQRVQPGDPLAVAMKPFKLKDRTGLSAIRRSMSGAHTDKSLRWDSDFEGEVVSVHKGEKGLAVNVRTVEPMQVGDKMCFDAQTEVLTAGGWKPVSAVTVADAVCCLDGERVTYQQPTAVHAYANGGRMYHLESQQVDLLVTEQHRMLVKERGKKDFTLRAAADIAGRRVRYKKSGEWDGPPMPEVVLPAMQIKAGQGGRGVGWLPEQRIAGRTYLMLLGMFLSEGNLLDVNSTYGIQFTQTKPAGVAQLLAALDSSGVRYTHSGEKITLYSKQLLEHFRQFGGAKEKFIPAYIFEHSRADLLLLFHWLMWGDGHRLHAEPDGRPVSYTSTSKQLIDDVQRLCLHIGYAANIKIRPEHWWEQNGRKYLASTCYKAQIVTTKLTPQVNHGHAKTQHGQYESWIDDYDGPVYCVTVPTHVLYVRRNGKPVWSGNSNRYGGKGIVTLILPDKEMPHTKDGKHIEVALNPSGLPGRMNPGQLFETAAGKIAEKTGKPYVVKNFDANVDSLAKVKADLKAHGLTDTEELKDPGTGQSLGQVAMGPMHVFKLVHQIDKKLSVRSGSGSLPGGGAEHYDLNLQPAGGSDTGGQSMGTLGLFALLAHGARANIREMQSYKSEGPDPQTDPAKKWPSDHHRIWAAIQTGQPLPPPKTSFVFRKFEDMLRGTGVNIDKRGHDLILSPMTNAQIIALAPKALPHPADLLSSKMDKNGDPKPRPGGLWDEHLTGGLGGRRWTRIELAEPLPNPMFESPVRALTGLSAKDFSDILNGAKGVTAGGHVTTADAGTTGGAGIKVLLDRIDVSKELTKSEAQLKSVKGQGVDRALKKVKYLRALKQINTSASDAYMLHNIPVLPPIMRPVSSLPDNRVRFDDVNQLYSDFAKINDKLKDPTIVRNLTDEGKTDLRKDYYDGVKAFMGIGKRYESADRKGLLHQIAGHTPKEGLFQSRLTSRKQDLAMRSTIVPEPALDLDEVGLPRHAALELFKPFVVHKLKEMGAIPDEMQGAAFIEKKSPQVWRALDRVMSERPVLLKRDPALHKYSVQAFMPKAVTGNAIQIHPLVTGGYTADFDGDQQIGAVIVFVSNSALHRGLASGVELWKTTAWWGSRALGEAMSARFYSMIPCLKDGALYLLDLSEVPHAEEHCTQGHIDFHPVPKGVEVLAYDERTGAVVPAGVSGWSFHRRRAVEFVTLASGRQIITDDDERGVYGLNAELNLVRSRPSASVGMFVPTMHTLSLDESYARIALPVQDDVRLKSHVELDGRTGRLLGTIIGDGWAAFANGKLKGQVVVAAEEGSVAVGFTQDLQAFFTEIPTVTPNERIGGDFGPEVVSRRYAVSSMAWSTLVSEWVGHMAENKHLPPFWAKTPRSFRIGLLAGYFDTDGSISISNGKAKKQWMLNSSTRSIRLANELRLLSASIGVKATITPSETPGGKSFWVVSYSIVDFHKLQEFPVSHADKRALFANFFSEDAPEEKNSYSQTDLVPMPKLLAKAMLRIVGTRYGASVYQRVYVSQSCGYMTRYTARHLVQLVSGYLSEDALFNRWAALVEQGHVRWDRVESFQATGVLEDGYDLTVPGYETFMSADGVILSNTMSVYVPITREAVAEAHKMKPSNNLFSEATGKLMYQPTLESALGLYKLSNVGKDSHKIFEHPGAALDAVRSGDLHYTDTVHIGSKKTTPGRILLASAVPEAMQDDVMHDLSYRIDGKGLSKLLTDIAKKHGPQYGEMVNKLKDLGNGAAFGAAAVPRSTAAGHAMKFSILDKTPIAVHDSRKDVFIPTGAHTLSLEDFTPDTALRDRVLAPAHKAVAEIRANSKLNKGEQDRQAIAVYEAAATDMKEQHEKAQDKDPSNLFTMYRAGVKPGWDQYKQLVLAPMIYKDSADKKLPTPVTKSYAEGLDIGSYWTQMHGARRGSVMKVQEVSGPGYLSKLLMSNMMNVLVNSSDCGTDKGVVLDVNEPDVHDRYLQQGFTHGQLHIPAGTMLTPDLVSKIRTARKDAKLLVRSPLKCEDELGICQKCAGANSSGQHFDMGHNIGVQSAQAVGERGVQLALKSFHTGGVGEQSGGSKLLSAFERFDQLVKLPETVPNESTLAMKSGRVEKVIPTATGVDVFIGGRRHHIGKDVNGLGLHHNLPNVNTAAESFVHWRPPVIGMHFDAGESLSDPNRTTLNPHHLYEATGSIEKVQNHLTNEIHNLFKEEGIKRRAVETVVRAMSNLTKVVDPGDHPDVLRGEFKPMSTIYKLNQELLRDNKAPIEHEPVMKGVNAMPLALQEDWMAKLQHERLRGTLMEAAAMGGVSHLHGAHPIPAVAFGSEFGLTSKDALRPGYAHLKDVPAHYY